MRLLTLDFETFYSREYSLSRMTPIEYILDHQFETIGCAVDMNGLSTFMSPDQLVIMLKRLQARMDDGEKVGIISHNATFDMSILAHRYNFVPSLMIDTLAMARAWYSHSLRSVSLAKVADFLGLPAKGTTVQQVIGMRRAEIISRGLYRAYADYSVHDAELTSQIYRRIMAEGFPKEELTTIDSVVRCAINPQFRLDMTALSEHLHAIESSKAQLLASVGMEDRTALMSNEKFADALRAAGVEPPTKISPTTGKVTYAFAKTDADFIELEEHPSLAVQALVAARLGTKSTIEETRTQRFINIGRLVWPTATGPAHAAKMPIPLRYSGAHTHRLSGDWKLNLQNLPRGGKLRKALKAPPGHVVVVGDSSQIEARMVAWFCGVEDLVADFAAGKDIYSSFASSVFGFPVNKKENPTERFVGKTAILGLGFGLGWMKFQSAVKMQSKAQTGTLVALSDQEALGVVNTYRGKFPGIPEMWSRLSGIIPQMTRKDCNVTVGPVTFLHEKVQLPNGMFLYYKNLRFEKDEWLFEYAGMTKRLYGGKLLENIIQALARICTMDAARRMRLVHGLHFAIQVHDELGYLVLKEHGDRVAGLLMQELCRRPKWAPDLPLAAEVEVGTTYGDAK